MSSIDITSSILRKVAVSSVLLFTSAGLMKATDPATWADVTGSDSNWYTSSWYNQFYYDSASYGDWIWHVDHSWQYVDSTSTSAATYIWDDASVSWWYTAQAHYPYVYSYGTNEWYYFMEGYSPDRVFWDFSRAAKVNESRLAALGSITNPYTNAEVTAATLDLGGAFNLFDAYPGATTAEAIDLVVGDATAGNVLTIQNGSTIHVVQLFIGKSTGGDTNRVIVTGSKSSLICSGSCNVGGSGTGNVLTVDALSAVYSNAGVPVFTTGNVVHLGSGFIGLTGDLQTEAAALVTAGNIMVHDTAGAWVTATSADVKIAYYVAATDAPAALAATGREDLAGYTVISSGEEMPDVSWAEATDDNSDWTYNSDWYGNFYTDVSYGTKIYHYVHGWQYIHKKSTPEGVYLWDDGTQSEWYTSKADYPNFYNYNTDTFYDYVSGVSPDRVFYDYTTKANVSEASIAALAAE